MRQALHRAEAGLGEGHPLTAACLGHLGELLSRIGRADEAVPLLRRAVALRERQLGPQDAALAAPLGDLALALRRQEAYAEAEPVGRRALALLERAGDADGERAAGVLDNLAQVLQHTGRSDEAEPLMRRAVALLERHLGPGHPSVAEALNNLARLLEDGDRADEAEPLSRRHVLIFQRAGARHRKAHPSMAAALDVHADLLRQLGLPDGVVAARLEALLAGKDPGPIDGPDAPARQPDGAAAAPGAAPGSGPDFDRLSREGVAPQAPRSATDALFAATYALPQWFFIARGDPGRERPYVARNPLIQQGAPMVKAFTDTRRLLRFAREVGLLDDGQCDADLPILCVPTPEVLPLLASLQSSGVTHIHFNADHASDGYYLPLVQMPIVHRHLRGLGLLP